MKSIFVTIFFCISGLVLAQESDSSSIALQIDSLIKSSIKYTAEKKYDGAEAQIELARKLVLEHFSQQSVWYSSCCLNAGLIAMNRGQYQKAESHFIESLDLLEKISKTDHPNFKKSLFNLAFSNALMDKHSKAKVHYLKLKSILSNSNQSDNREYLMCLRHLANVYYNLAEFDQAEELYLECKQIIESNFGKDHPDYSLTINGIANLALKLGDYPKAEKYYLEAKGILESKKAQSALPYLNNLNNLGKLYFAIENYTLAEEYFIQAKKIAETVLGTQIIEYPISLFSIAKVYSATNRYKEAEEYFYLAKTAWEKSFALDQSEYYSGFVALAKLYVKMGDFKQAEECYLKSKLNQEKLLDKNHPSYVETLKALAIFYEIQNRFNESDLLINTYSELSKFRLVKSISFLSESELSKYSVRFQAENNQIENLMFRRNQEAPNSKVADIAYNNELFYKGFLLNASLGIRNEIKLTDQSIRLNEQLQDYRRLYVSELSKPISKQKDLISVEAEINSIEKELVKLIPDYEEGFKQIQWTDVQNKLKPGACAIEFINFKLSFPYPTDSIIYAALLIKPGLNQPIFIPLFEEKSLDTLLFQIGVQDQSEKKTAGINNLYASNNSANPEANKITNKLSKLIWQPLQKDLLGIKTIYFSPSGLLNRINLSAIPFDELGTMTDHYQVIELISTRQIVSPTKSKHLNDKAILFGGIQFEPEAINDPNETNLALNTKTEKKAFENVDSSLKGGNWNYLAGTEREVQALSKIIQMQGLKASILNGHNATEESFKNIGTNNQASPRIIHLATHGYFFSDPEPIRASSTTRIDSTMLINSAQANNTDYAQTPSRNQNTSSNLVMEEPAFRQSENPMLRSGLILSGGNAGWKGKRINDQEDGVLTAYEISQLDLSNTELVVLSACETGLGDIQGNEGVYGLQRAFKIAGVKYLIMSLWRVPDQATKDFMILFYSEWLNKNNSIPDAFQKAQKLMRFKYPKAINWAGFVLIE